MIWYGDSPWCYGMGIAPGDMVWGYMYGNSLVPVQKIEFSTEDILLSSWILFHMIMYSFGVLYIEQRKQDGDEGESSEPSV